MFLGQPSPCWGEKEDRWWWCWHTDADTRGEMLFAKWAGGWGMSEKFKVQEYLWQSTPQLAPLSDFEMDDPPPPSSHSRCCLLPSSSCLIESSYLLRFMKNSANLICRQSLGRYLIFLTRQGDGNGRFGCWAETVIIYRQRGNSSLGDKEEMEQGGGWRLARCWEEITQSVLALSKCRRIVQGLVSQMSYKAETAFCCVKC